MTQTRSPFREGSRWLRNACEIALLVMIVIGLRGSERTPDADELVAAHRAAIELDCEMSESEEERDYALGYWLYRHATGQVASGQVCGFTTSGPTVSTPGQFGRDLALTALLFGGLAAAVVWLVARFKTVVRGALVGREVLVASCVVAVAAGLTAGVLRYRLYAAYDRITADFASYRRECWRTHATFLANDDGLRLERQRICSAHRDDWPEICDPRVQAEQREAAYRKLCNDEAGRDREICTAYRFHVAQRTKAVKELGFERCREIADALPATQYARYLPELGVEPAAVEPVEVTTEPPRRGLDEGGDEASDTPPPPGVGLGGGGGGAATDEDDPGVTSGGPPTSTPSGPRTREEIIEEIRREHPGLPAPKIEAIAALMLLGVPLPVALSLGLFGSDTEDGERKVTKRKIVREVEQQLRRGETPSFSAELSDELAELAKGDPSIAEVLPMLRQTHKVQQVRDTQACASAFTLSEEQCGSPEEKILAAAAEQHRKNCAQPNTDQLGLVAIACCACPSPGNGCAEIRRLRPGYLCSPETP